MKPEILFYDWDKIINNLSNPLDIIRLIKNNIKKDFIPKNAHYIKYHKSIFGSSFILEPSKLLYSKNSPIDILFYMLLASYRNYAEYTMFNKLYLEYSIVSGIFSKEEITNNSLLTLTKNNNIYFNYERNYVTKIQ